MAGILGSISLLSPSNLLLSHHHRNRGSISLLSPSNLLLSQHHRNRQIQNPVLRMRTRCTLKKQQQQNDNKLQKILVVNGDAQSKSLEISLLSITEREGITNKITVSSGPLPIASCHGLLLTTMGWRPQRLHIWNPSSKDDDDEVIRTIPQSSVPRPPTSVYETDLMFGFGFDPSSNDYKIIRFVDLECGEYDSDNFNLRKLLVELYSLKTQSWKQIAFPHGARAVGGAVEWECFYINGFFYFTMSLPCPNTNRLLILPFDLSNDNFSCAPIPGPDISGFEDHLLIEFEGSLAVIAYQTKPFEFELWVWNNNNNDESWSKRGEWAIDDDVNSYFPLGQFVTNGQIFLQNTTGELVLFDFAKQKVKNLGFYAVHGYYLSIFPYVGSSSSAKEIK